MTTAIGKKTSDVVRGIDEVFKVLSAAGSSGDNDACKKTDNPDALVQMKNCAARMRHNHPFKKGQLVKWKEGLKNRKTPAYGEPIIVVDVLKEPVYDCDSKNSASPFFYEPLTLVAGEITLNGEFMCYHYDGRRFEPFIEAERDET